MQPLATYRETGYDTKRTFELFADRLVIRGGQTFGADFDAEVPLAHLNLTHDRLRVRNPHFQSGVAIVTVCTGVITFLKYGWHYSLLSEPALMLAIFGFCGLIVMAGTYQKVEYYQFKTAAGIVAFDIARNQKNSGEFDAFIEQLGQRIE